MYPVATVVFEFSYTSALLCLDSRIIDPEAVAPDWTGDKSPLFRPLSRLVGVSYNTVV
jgi:hypothetical protein